MIKQVAGKKINLGVGAQMAGAGIKPSLVSQDLIAQFSKLVEEISAQMELINQGVEGKGRSIGGDPASERQAQNGQGQGQGHLAGQDAMIGMGAASSRGASKDRGSSGDLTARFEDDAKSVESRQSVQRGDSKVEKENSDVRGFREDDLTDRHSRGSIAINKEDGQRSDPQHEKEREINSDQNAQELDYRGDSQQQISAEPSGHDAERLGLATDGQSTFLGAESLSSDLNPEPTISNGQGESIEGKSVIISESRDVVGQSLHAQSINSRDEGLNITNVKNADKDLLISEAEDSSKTEHQEMPTTIMGDYDEGISEMPLEAPVLPLTPEGQLGRGARGNPDQKGPSAELDIGPGSQDEQLLGALREQAGQRVQETAANNNKLAKAIFERLAGDSGRGDLNARALDGAAGASSSSAMLGDTLGRLSQGEKFLPRKDRVLLSQGVQLRTMERIEQALKEVERSKDGKSISIRLDPPNLGHVRTDITLNDGVLYARFVPENRDVAQLLKERASELQAILKRAGFDADRVQISVSSDSLNEQSRGNEPRSGSGSSFEGQTSGEQLFQRQGYQGEGGTDSGKDGWRERGFEQNIGLGAGRAGSKTDDHWVA